MPFAKSGNAATSGSKRSTSFGFRATLGVTLGSLLSSVCFAAHQMQDVPTAASSVAGGSDQAPSKKIVLKVDGAAKEVPFEVGATLGSLLKSQNITLSASDRCSVPLDSTLVDGAAVSVTRIRTEEIIERTKIAFPSKQTYSATLAIGTKQIKQAGKPGERVVKCLCTFVDGKITVRIKHGQSVIPPVPQVEIVGTRGMTLASRGFFGGRRIIEMVATGYGPDGNGRWGAQTASGLRPGFGVVAVDPRFIPLGTRLFIEGYGYAVAGDTGGAIKGNRIDLGWETNEEAAAVGRKTVRVLVLN